ncbi:MAG: ribosome-associated translation inhibitor RaiA [Saprospiraceae bacterium]|nr:ribosome-associated translation inhibitor RaiA [Saprospiraceae bacterium]
MMKIQVKSVHFHADSKLLAFIEEKISRLNRYFEHTLEAEVHLKLQDTGARVREKIAEIRLKVPGSVLVYKKSGKSFEVAVHAAADNLKRQLVQFKERRNRS